MNIRDKISVVSIISKLDVDLAEELELMDKEEFVSYLAYLIKKYERGSVGERSHNKCSCTDRSEYGRGHSRPNPIYSENKKVTERPNKIYREPRELKVNENVQQRIESTLFVGNINDNIKIVEKEPQEKIQKNVQRETIIVKQEEVKQEEVKREAIDMSNDLNSLSGEEISNEFKEVGELDAEAADLIASLMDI